MILEAGKFCQVETGVQAIRLMSKHHSVLQVICGSLTRVSKYRGRLFAL